MITQTRQSSLLKLRTMLEKMPSPIDKGEVGKVVVKRVSINMVHDQSLGDGTMGALPNQHGARLPYIGFSNLGPGTFAISPLVPFTNSDSTNRDLICWDDSGFECSGARCSPTFRVITGLGTIGSSAFAMIETPAALWAYMVWHPSIIAHDYHRNRYLERQGTML